MPVALERGNVRDDLCDRLCGHRRAELAGKIALQGAQVIPCGWRVSDCHFATPNSSSTSDSSIHPSRSADSSPAAISDISLVTACANFADFDLRVTMKGSPSTLMDCWMKMFIASVRVRPQPA